MQKDEHQTPRFKIGSVARLTGIPVETLRVWERRYGVVTPHRTAGGSRLYDRQDVARLLVIKRLVDAGNAISTIAQLSLEQLEQHESHSASLQDAEITVGPTRVSIIGSSLPARLKDSLDSTYDGLVTLAGTYANIEHFESDTANESPDGVIVEIPTLMEDSARQLRHLQRAKPEACLVVVYSFAKRQLVRQLESLGITPMQQPANWPELLKVLGCSSANPPALPAGTAHAVVMEAPVPKREFDDNQLARIASVTTNVNCECPHHVANLVISLSHFELYSAECENLSDEDAALHAYLHRATAQARSLMESTLQLILESDNIDIETIPSGFRAASTE